MHCDIYKSSKKDEMYLYIAAKDSTEQAEDYDPLAVLPDMLRQAFGRATFVMQLEIYQERKLARVSALHVIDSIAEKGYFIQLPPDGLINSNAVEPEGLRGA
ncbi:YcgL domain-containing protein [Acinetobacter larvae]|uniref:YcgL domain-containing protein BFG52_09905 n=1 Tax=Acinetobacter larvae TaxID=1789224 RepID=A0A1B2M0A0_9GAMM|nr:YcgL domain-containing protein [Acinetobacter larvae]AOA58634.1 hypothetical protein BFG52_09905 [Acinetobacter larvae]